MGYKSQGKIELHDSAFLHKQYFVNMNLNHRSPIIYRGTCHKSVPFANIRAFWSTFSSQETVLD